MSDTDKTISFREREFRGSRLRCLLLTSQEPAEIAKFLSNLVAPHAKVDPAAQWAPRGLCEPDEAKLGETAGFLSEKDRQMITDWWLAMPGRANTPNWDLVSSCLIGDRKGLILVEAKAHESELGDDHCGATNQQNFKSIQAALGQATKAWNELLSGFALSVDSHYQLSNRFAFAWKVAELGTPVVLVYLGFLNAHEMGISCRLLKSDEQWRACVLKKSAGLVPEQVWDKTFQVNGTPLTVLIRSAVVTITAEVMDTRDVREAAAKLPAPPVDAAPAPDEPREEIETEEIET
jgi:hypothetical protein